VTLDALEAQWNSFKANTHAAITAPDLNVLILVQAVDGAGSNRPNGLSHSSSAYVNGSYPVVWMPGIGSEATASPLGQPKETASLVCRYGRVVSALGMASGACIQAWRTLPYLGSLP
jgi:hypothetical protein